MLSITDVYMMISVGNKNVHNIIHDDIVYSLKRWVFTIDLKQSIVLAFFI